jgi:Uma2 family endonuclease
MNMERSLGTTTKIPVEEYLHTAYRPDVEYVDGEIQERNVGEIEHARLIMAVLEWFFQHRRDWGIEVLPDVRMQISATRFRVPDICVCSASSADRRIVTTPPLLVVEVLSPEDRIDRYHQRIDDYRQMGVQGIWVLDPETHRGWDCSSGNWIEGTLFRLAESPVHLDLKALFAQ